VKERLKLLCQQKIQLTPHPDLRITVSYQVQPEQSHWIRSNPVHYPKIQIDHGILPYPYDVSAKKRRWVALHAGTAKAPDELLDTVVSGFVHSSSPMVLST
jgi:hypothetical protein